MLSSLISRGATVGVLLVLTTTAAFVITGGSATSHAGSELSQRDHDLSSTFTKFQIVKLNPADAARQVAQGHRLALNLPDRTLDIMLAPHDLRAPNYRLTETGAEGLRKLTPGPVSTFKGTVVSQPDSAARFSLNGRSVSGMLLIGSNEYFLESARKYSNAAAEDDLVFYESTDLRHPLSIQCDVADGELVNRAVKQVARSAQVPGANQVIDLATEADYLFTHRYFGDSVPDANAEVLRLMNFVEAIYERDVNLTFRITFQHYWTTPDPFVGDTRQDYLVSFQTYWNNTFANVGRDHAHMFSGRTGGAFSGSGQTFLGRLCQGVTTAFGFSTRVTQDPQEYVLVAHEIGHVLNATHPTAPECLQTIMVPIVEFTNTAMFCQFSKNEINTYVATHSQCLAPETSNRFDYDGDGKTDHTVFRPAEGAWYRINSSDGAFIATGFGQNGDRPVPGDYDGDAKADLAVFRPVGGGWFRLASSNGAFSGTAFGVSTDIPAAADFDGDGRTDIAVYRPAEGGWYILNSSDGSLRTVSFGIAEDIPVAQDFDGDGKADVGVFRGSVGGWYSLNSSDGGVRATQFGAQGDKPVPADFDGDGKADVAVFRPAVGGWYILSSATGAFTAVGFGISTDRPVASDFDGDGKAEVAVFRAGSWYMILSSNGSFVGQTFGIPGDLPAPASYVP